MNQPRPSRFAVARWVIVACMIVRLVPFVARHLHLPPTRDEEASLTLDERRVILIIAPEERVLQSSFLHSSVVDHPTMEDEQRQYYTDDQSKILGAIAGAAMLRFPPLTLFPSEDELKQAVRQFGLDHGFSVAFKTMLVVCSRGGPKVKKRVHVEDESKQRKSKSMNCGCDFRIRYSPVKATGQVKITYGSSYRHSNGCFPCKEGLNKTLFNSRKASDFSSWLSNKRQGTAIRAIAAMVLEHGKDTKPRWLKAYVRELYPKEIEITGAHPANLKQRLLKLMEDRHDSAEKEALYNQLFGEEWVCQEEVPQPVEMPPALASLFGPGDNPLGFPTTDLTDALSLAPKHERECFKELCADLVQYWTGQRALPLGASFADYIPMHMRGRIYKVTAAATAQEAAKVVAAVRSGQMPPTSVVPGGPAAIAAEAAMVVEAVKRATRQDTDTI